MTKKTFAMVWAFILPFDAGVWMMVDSWHNFVLAIGYLASKAAYVKQVPHPVGYVTDFIIGLGTAVLGVCFLIFYLKRWIDEVNAKRDKTAEKKTHLH